MPDTHVGLTKKEFGELVNVVFSLERTVHKIHSWMEKGVDSTEEKHMHEIYNKAKNLSNTYEHKYKHIGHAHSLDDDTLLLHLKSLSKVLNTWRLHEPLSAQNEDYDEHTLKYNRDTSTIHKMNTWYKNPRYKHHKNKKRKPKNKDKPAGHVAPSADHGGHVAPVVHHTQQENRLTGLLEKLKM